VLDDGSIMTEVIGICVYLESLYPDRPLLGTTGQETAELISWDHKIFLTFLQPIADMLRNGSEAFADRALPGTLNVPQMPALIERGRLRLDHAFSEMDSYLEGRDWVSGNSFTLADIDLFCCISFAGWVKQTVPESCHNIQRWMQQAQQHTV
jgi:glutathione S-transferase